MGKVWILWVGIIALAITVGLYILWNPPNESFSTPASFSGWKRLDRATLVFRGSIGNGSFQKMKSMLDDQVRTLIITSPGGEVEPAIRMGELVLAHNLDVVAERYCLSSCANYIFLAGKHKFIRNGIVGFHGDITYSINQAGGLKRKVEQEAQRVGLSKEKQKEFEGMIRKTIDLERSFLEKIGVPQRFFAFTGNILLGKQGKDQVYSFVLPKKETFKKYGITDIQGHQSMEWKGKVEEQYGIKLLLH